MLHFAYRCPHMQISSVCCALMLSCLFHTSAAAFDGIRVTLLGTAATDPTQERAGLATLIEAGDAVLLFDCGRGARQRLEQAGVSPIDIDAVFLSRLHSDRSEGMAELKSSRDRAKAAAPLLVYGPAGTEERFMPKPSDPSGNGTSAAGEIDARDITENLVYQSADVIVTAIVVSDDPGAIAYGYRIDYQGRRTVVLSGDTGYSSNLVQNARGSEVLVHDVAAAGDAALENSDHVRRLVSAHTTPEDAARVFREARPYLAVFSPVLLFDVSEDEVLERTMSRYRGPVQMGRDLMVIEIQNEVQIRSAPSEPRNRSN
jgi:ribonuclease Z